MSAPVRVLIIDDDPTFRAVLRRLFDRYFTAEIEEAPDGAEGLAAVERMNPELVLLDLSMPKLDGFETLERLRALEGHKDLPVVAVSATNDKGKVVRLIELGVADYLLKPINVQLARRRLQRVVDAIERRRAEHPKPSSDHVA